MQTLSGHIAFRIDPQLSAEVKKNLDELIVHLEHSEKSILHDWNENRQDRVIVDFISENSLHLLRVNRHLKVCILEANQGLFSFEQNLEASGVDAILDENIDLNQLNGIIAAELEKHLSIKEKRFSEIALKNLKKLESAVKTIGNRVMTSDSLMDYTQFLVDLEKDLIHQDEISRIEKVLKQFVKNNFEKTKVHVYQSSDLWNLAETKNLILLPRFRGDFVLLEMNWEDQNPEQLLKKYFFLSTIISFFSSQEEVQDPFFDSRLWEEVTGSIPFPLALISESGEVRQHNTLFVKLNISPTDCLKFKLREKILINDIPYNIFKKEIDHLGEKKIIFVFFTESFFLKGDGNMTPTGQELGIISSSIAHELNNPIAGVQAALTFLMLDDSLDEDAKQTLIEMKKGAQRCKQLVETFLGFSRVNPLGQVNPEVSKSLVDVCYQQAQNLLRFRTVESGIRISLTYSKHSDFRAQVNVSLLTMTFYLILGELMTLYSHQLLVASKNQIEKVIKGEIIESSQEIQIQLTELNISSLSLSKLIQNLLNIENFVLQISDYSLRFIYNPKGA
jgi:His Kinase A (phospho-acceptor) domain